MVYDYKRSWYVALVALLLGGQAGVYAQPSATVFTYQGSLVNAGDHVSGLYDLRFRLFNSATGGMQVGEEVLTPGTPVQNGLFSVPLDFGTVIDGSGHWVEIEVRPAGSGDYTLLSPRQAVHASPLATFALNAGEATTATVAMNGVPSGSMILGNSSTPPPGYTWSGQTVSGDGEKWTPKADAPIALSRLSGDMIDGKLYAVRNSNTMVYDPATDTWDDSLASCPSLHNGFHGVLALNEKLYVWGMIDSVPYGTTSGYDPTTDTWVALVDTAGDPVLTAYVFNGKLHSIYSHFIRIYDPVEDQWIVGENVPAAAYYQLAVIDGKLYWIGESTSYVYDLTLGESAEWLPLPGMPTQRDNFSVVAFQGKIHVLGGRSGGVSSSAHEIFDPVSQSWSAGVPLSSSRSNPLVVTDDRYIYVVGGDHNEGEGNTALTTMERFEPGAVYYVHVKD